MSDRTSAAFESQRDPIERRDRLALQHLFGFAAAFAIQWAIGVVVSLPLQLGWNHSLVNTGVRVSAFEGRHRGTANVPDTPRSIEAGLPFRGNFVIYGGGEAAARSPRVQDQGFIFRPGGTAFGGRQRDTVVLPLRPHAGPSFANAAMLYGVVAWYPWFRRVRRLRAGRCPDCQYPLRPGAVCSECGTDPDET
ncbi:MAG: hypothetical protein AB8G96_01130 [Phycisphaerales bacterium]